MKILYIHGAKSTKRSFAYLNLRLRDHERFYFEYDTEMETIKNISDAQKMCNEVNPDVIIGHSLGGIIAAYLITPARRITIATPFGGSEIAAWLPISQLLRDIASNGPLIAGIRRLAFAPENLLTIVANGLDGRGFDGVVSTRSQKAIEAPTVHEFNLNHFEVLVDDTVAKRINDWM